MQKFSIDIELQKLKQFEDRVKAIQIEIDEKNQTLEKVTASLDEQNKKINAEKTQLRDYISLHKDELKEKKNDKNTDISLKNIEQMEEVRNGMQAEIDTLKVELQSLQIEKDAYVKDEKTGSGQVVRYGLIGQVKRAIATRRQKIAELEFQMQWTQKA